VPLEVKEQTEKTQVKEALRKTSELASETVAECKNAIKRISAKRKNLQ